MNAPMMPLIRRDRDADRHEAERVVAVLYEQIGEINKIVAGEEDAATIAELERLRDDLRIAGDLLCAYAAGLALATPDPVTQACLVERFALADQPAPVDEVLLIWMSDELDCRLPWLGHLDERGQWWFVDSGMARNVTHWAYRPEVRQ